jgi:hypothetical protein
LTATPNYTGDAEVDHLLFSWGRVIRDSEGWARGFALSIQRARKKSGWMPSTRQLSVMRQLVADLPANEADSDPQLIDVEG